MKNLTWQNPEQLFVAQELINKVKSKCCGIKDNNNIIKYLKTNNTIPVPKYFYMAILSLKNGQYKAIGFWFEHKSYSNNNYASYALSIDELEEKTGIDFFHNLPDNIENEVERSYNKSDWGL